MSVINGSVGERSEGGYLPQRVKGVVVPENSERGQMEPLSRVRRPDVG